jgi:hypothetical protein
MKTCPALAKCSGEIQHNDLWCDYIIITAIIVFGFNAKRPRTKLLGLRV